MLARILHDPRTLCALSGILLALSFPSADCGFLAFIALVPLLIALRDATPMQAFNRGLGTGFVFFGILLSWIGTFAGTKIGKLGTVAGLAAALLQAFFIGFFALALVLLRGKKVQSRQLNLILVPSIWVLFEFVRQMGNIGMGWGDLGYTQWRNPAMLVIAPFTGVWGMSWLIVLVNNTIANWNRRSVLLTITLLALFAICGKLSTLSVKPSAAPYTAAAIQSNIDQDVYWEGRRPADNAYFQNTLATFDDMGYRASKQNGAKLLLFAETAAPGYVRFDPVLNGRLSALSESTGAAIVTGARDTDRATQKDRNVAVLYLPNQPDRIIGEYAKQQLVPFGEFVPFQDQLQWISVLRVANFNDEPGEADQQPLNADSRIGKVGVGICYESTYPKFLRQQTRYGANILTIITDDTWFGHTAAARQHLAMSAIRAAENHRYLVRSAATGISAIFAPDGHELGEVGLFTKGIVAEAITPESGLTFFVRFGDWLVWLCGGVVAISAFKRRSNKAPGKYKGRPTR